MARKLSHITTKITRYLATYYTSSKIFNGKITIEVDTIFLPKPMKIAFLRGEALFCERFFKTLEQKNITDSLSQYNNYQALVDDKKFFQKLAEDVKLLDFFNISGNNPNHNTKLGYQLYCVILFDAKNRNDTNLIDAMTTGFVNHFLPTLYPQKPKNSDVAFLKKELTLALRRKWHLKISIKESFTTEKQAKFSLFLHIQGYQPTLLISRTGARLKPTRINTYQEIIALLKNPNFEIDLPKKSLAKA